MNKRLITTFYLGVFLFMCMTPGAIAAESAESAESTESTELTELTVHSSPGSTVFTFTADEEENLPSSIQSPQTGDDFHIAAWSLIAVISFASFILTRYRKHENT